jgi:hypothetical protein
MEQIKNVVIIPKYDSVYSPFYNDSDGVFIDGVEYKSVASYMDKHPTAAFQKAFLAKFTQHVHYQKQISCLEHASIAWMPADDWEHQITYSFTYIVSELQKYSDNEWISMFGPWANTVNANLVKDRIQYAKNAQVFMGKQQALFVSLVWINKKVYECTYDKRLEKLMNSILT